MEQVINQTDPNELLGKLNSVEEKFAPKKLYFVGSKHILKDHIRVSVIGTRNPKTAGKVNATKISQFLVDNNVVVVSGLAKGIDTIAHVTAIENNGKTIAVLGTPLDKCYPYENVELLNIIKRNHLAISQFPTGSKTFPSSFPMRNRTMALLSHASIIVEAGEKSGTQHQGWEALRLGRPLFISEELVEKKLIWVQKMISYGAKALSMKNLNEILEEIPNPHLKGLEIEAF